MINSKYKLFKMVFAEQIKNKLEFLKLCARRVKIRKKAIYYSKEPRREKLDANLLLIEILHCNFCYTFIKYAIIN